MSHRRLTLGAAALLLAAGCGTGSPSDQVTAALRADVLSVTQAVAGGDRAAAQTALDALRGDVAAAVRSGTLTQARADRILAAAAAVAARLGTGTPSTTPTRPASPSPSPTLDAKAAERARKKAEEQAKKAAEASKKAAEHNGDEQGAASPVTNPAAAATTAPAPATTRAPATTAAAPTTALPPASSAAASQAPQAAAGGSPTP